MPWDHYFLLVAAHWPSFWVVFTVTSYGLGIANCFRIIQERENPASTYAWILLHVTIPFLALPLYYVFGRNRLPSYTARKEAAQEKVLDEQKKSWSILFKSPFSERLLKHCVVHDPSLRQQIQIFQQLLSKLSQQEGFAQLRQSHCQLLIDGHETFQEIFSAIENAKKFIFVQYYILRSDRLGLEFKNLLIRKAREGVKTFILYDDMGSFWLSKDYIRDLRQAGIAVVNFLPVLRLNRFLQINFRNHRKIVIVDGLRAFTGGLNLGEEYVGIGDKESYWRDTHIEIDGTLAIFDLINVFLGDWFFSVDDPDLKMAPLRILNESFLPQIERLIDKQKLEENLDGEQKLLQILPTGPTDEKLIAPYTFLQFIELAQKRLWIATPYFIPDAPLRWALELAAYRGVDVRILIPGARATSPAQWATVAFAEMMQHSPVKFFRYQKGFMHQKIVLVDDQLTAIGSCNFDNRALYYNFETTVIVHDKEFAEQTHRMLELDFRDARAFCLELPFVKNKLIRLRNRLAWLLAPLL